MLKIIKLFEVLNNFNATVDPTVNDDNDDGYDVGSTWINITDDKAFKCLDVTVGAAIWRETTKRSILSDSVFPASGDFVGQRFRANSGDYSNRDITYEWDGSVWQPKEASGAVTFFVDKTDGTDSPDKGFAVDSDAFATLQFAVDQIPPLYSGDVQINVNDEIYSETVVIRGKTATGNFEITIEGIMTTEAAKSGIDSETATTITDTGAFTALTLEGMLIEFTKAGETNRYNIVKSHTNNVITIAGQHNNLVDDTWDYEILSWDTKIQGEATNDNYAIQIFSANVKIFKIDFTNNAAVNNFGVQFSGVAGTVQACTYNATASDHRRGIDAQDGAFVTTNGNYINQSNNSSTIRDGGLVSSLARISDSDSWWRGASGPGDGIIVQGNASWGASRSLYSHWDDGVRLDSSSGSRLNTGATAKIYVENCTTGLRAVVNGSIVNGLAQNFSANTADTATATGGQIT